MKTRKLTFLFMMGLLMVPPLAAGPVGISIKDTTLVRGTTAYIAVRVDSSLTGLGVRSYELEITYSTTALNLESASEGGTMTESWGSPTVHLSPGRIRVAGASTTDLAGTGVLVYLRVSAPPGLTGTGYYLQFIRMILNEGDPATTTRNGYITVNNPPTITIYSAVGLIAVGDTRQFSVSGGAPPYVWSTTDASIGTINSSGLFTAVGAGLCRVVAVDNIGTKDSSDVIEVRAFKVVARDTSIIQGRTFLLPIYVTDMSQASVRSGTFSLGYSHTILDGLGIETNGTLLENFGVVVCNVDPGKITVSFADTSQVDGVGWNILIYLRMKVTDIQTGGSQLTFGDVLFNEESLADVDNGYFTVIPRAVLSVSPSSASVVKGDSLQFTAGGAVTPPVTWSVSDTSLAIISEGGLLKVLQGGEVTVHVSDITGGSGTSGTISLFDARITLPRVGAKAGDTVDVPILLQGSGLAIYSFQTHLGFSQAYIHPLAFITAGTLTESWNVVIGNPTPGTDIVAGASTTPITAGGTLIIVRFRVDPAAPLGDHPVSATGMMFNEGSPVGLVTSGNIRVGLTDAGEESRLPSSVRLFQNFPNPFNPSTTIRYWIPSGCEVSIDIYDVAGRRVRRLIDEYQSAGEKRVEWNGADEHGRDVPSGTYFVRMVADTFSEVKKILLMR